MILSASAWDITGKPIDCCVPSFFALELRVEALRLDFGLAAGLDETEGEVKSMGGRDGTLVWVRGLINASARMSSTVPSA